MIYENFEFKVNNIYASEFACSMKSNNITLLSET